MSYRIIQQGIIRKDNLELKNEVVATFENAAMAFDYCVKMNKEYNCFSKLYFIEEPNPSEMIKTFYAK